MISTTVDVTLKNQTRALSFMLWLDLIEVLYN